MASSKHRTIDHNGTKGSWATLSMPVRDWAIIHNMWVTPKENVIMKQLSGRWNTLDKPNGSMCQRRWASQKSSFPIHPVSSPGVLSCPVLLNREERESISSLVSVADVTMLYSPAIPQGLVWSKCRTKKQTFWATISSDSLLLWKNTARLH